MKYRLNSSGTDLLEITVEGERIVAVETLVAPADGSPAITPEELQADLALYTHPGSDNTTLEEALAAYGGGFTSWVRVDG